MSSNDIITIISEELMRFKVLEESMDRRLT
jgi:hypothetical protein